MTGESKKNKNSCNEKENLGGGAPIISTSMARGVVVLIAALLVFQIGTFIWDKICVSDRVIVPEGNQLGERESRRGDGMQPAEGDLPVYGGTRSFDKSSAKDSNLKSKRMRGKQTVALFDFDPNTITLDSLVLLGFSPKQGAVILNYREKGGRFWKKEDFAKMYVVSDEKYAALEGRIFIGKDVIVAERHDNTMQQRGQQLDSTSRKAEWCCNLNTADSTEFVKLYGIGAYFAKKILHYRNRLGGSFVKKEQLLEIEGMDMERYEKFKEKLVIEEEEIGRFSIEELDLKFMEQHPYIGAYAARGIVLYRKSRKGNAGGKITTEELVGANILSADAAAKLNLYLK